MTPIVPDLWRHLAPLRDLPYGPRWPREVDCSTLVAHVVQEHYGTGLDVWRAIQLSEPGAGPWDGLEATAAALGTEPCRPYAGPHQPSLGRLHYVQAWSDLSPSDEIVPDRPGQRGSRGHAWLWLSFGGWLGVVVEANRPEGPRVWDGRGVRPLREVVADDGRLVAELHPLDWDVRVGAYDAAGWVVLP